MATSAGYKPSPLGYGSQRTSPFRRPESPSSPTTLRQTPTASPTKSGLASGASRFANTSSTPTASADRYTGRGYAASGDDVFTSPRAHRMAPAPTSTSAAMSSGNALSQLQPSQVRTLREGFQILDRDSDGVVNREDVADMLNQLGLPSSAADVSQFFPPSAPQTATLAAFLNSIAASLAALSPSAELLSALSAFDDDDSGQVDLAELRDALLNTAPEPGERPLTAAEVDRVMGGFAGRRAFSKSKQGGGGGGGGLGGSKRGEVFRYQDFVNSINGTNGGAEAASAERSEDA